MPVISWHPINPPLRIALCLLSKHQFNKACCREAEHTNSHNRLGHEVHLACYAFISN